MFEDKTKDKIDKVKATLEEFTEHMYMLSDGMVKFQQDITMISREINFIKSYVEIVGKVLDKSGIIEKSELEELVIQNASKKMKKIQDDFMKYKKDMTQETEDMKHLIEKFKSSIGNWFDEDGNPIAKA